MCGESSDCAMTTWKWGLDGLIRRACGSLARSGKKWREEGKERKRTEMEEMKEMEEMEEEKSKKNEKEKKEKG